SRARGARRDRARWRILFREYQVVLLSYGVESDRPPLDRSRRMALPASLASIRRRRIDEPARSTCRDRPCRNRPARSVTGASRLCGALGPAGWQSDVDGVVGVAALPTQASFN